MEARLANPDEQKNIRQTQLDKLKDYKFPAIWPKTSSLSEFDKGFIFPRKEVHEMRRINLSLGINLVECTLLFYKDYTADIILITHGKGSQQLVSQIKDSKRLTGDSPLALKEEHIHQIFLKEGLSISSDVIHEEFSYREIFRLLTGYFSWLEDQV